MKYPAYSILVFDFSFFIFTPFNMFAIYTVPVNINFSDMFSDVHQSDWETVIRTAER